RREQKSLHLLDAGLAHQKGELGPRLDAFDHHRHAQIRREPGNAGQELARTARCLDILDKGAVDLDLIEREMVQIAQAGIARAEIVERYAHPEPLEVFEHGAGNLERLDSVISSSSRWAGRPERSSADVTERTTSPRRNWMGEILTATPTAPGQVVHCLQASCRIQSASSSITLVASASGMNSAGEIVPRSGWFSSGQAS